MFSTSERRAPGRDRGLDGLRRRRRLGSPEEVWPIPLPAASSGTRRLIRHAAAVLDWLWPSVCPRCSGRASAPQERWCPACWNELRPLGEKDRSWEIASAHGAVRAVAAFAVDALFLNMLTTSKYQRVRPVGRRLGRAASLHLERSPHLAEVAGSRLVPVPLTRGKLRERGFNQPEDFARDLAGRIGAEVRVDLLVRVQSGKASAGRARSERAAAVRGAFAAPEAAAPVSRGSVKVRPAPLWIVDDVITTGSTAVACACALRASGVTVAGILAMGRAFESGDTVPQPSDLLTRL